MPHVRTVVVEFLAEHLADRQNTQDWLIQRLRHNDDNSTTLNGSSSNNNNNSSADASDQSIESRHEWEPIVDRLIAVDREFQIFVNNKYDDRFSELTEPLVSRLRSGSSRKYYEAFKRIANELFNGEPSWIRIVTFLVYSAELVNRVLTELATDDRDKTFKMVSQVIRCTCMYFEENLLQWIESQEGGWNNLIEITKGADDNNRNGASVNGCRGIKQYIGVAAFAAVIGGLYLCSKLTVQ